MTMTGTRRFVMRMAIFIAIVFAIAVLLSSVLLAAFNANPGLNSFILGVLLLGIVFIFREVLRLNPEVAWVEAYKRGQFPLSSAPKTRLLGPMATMLGEPKSRRSLSAASTRSLLDSIGSRLDEDRDIARYMIGLMIMLGLLGTFYGLIQTVGSVGDVVGQLSMGGDPAVAFEGLKKGLATPLSAMGTAFGSSLFGLAGSLVLGFLDLQAGQAQNRFYNELEEWLAGQTRLSSGSVGSDGDQSVPAYIQALLEQTADSLESLQRTMGRGEESRMQANSNLNALVEKLGVLTDQMRTEQALMVKLAESQIELKPIFQKVADHLGRGGDDASRAHLRSLDNHLARLLEEQSSGRAEVIQEVRAEIRLLARTIAALAEEER